VRHAQDSTIIPGTNSSPASWFTTMNLLRVGLEANADGIRSARLATPRVPTSLLSHDLPMVDARAWSRYSAETSRYWTLRVRIRSDEG